ncbi:MAG: hypothetical protein GEU99_02790 [Luteitalea sp.]|nr:hypothetical protein [Luteitalea sp.]
MVARTLSGASGFLSSPGSAFARHGTREPFCPDSRLLSVMGSLGGPDDSDHRGSNARADELLAVRCQFGKPAAFDTLIVRARRHFVLEVRDGWGAHRPILLAGHSRGAALAGRFAARHATQLAGLAMIGTTHPRDDDQSTLTIPVLKVVASRDCVAAPDDARANAGRLPSHTRWVEIAGGNHAQFGYYGSAR